MNYWSKMPQDWMKLTSLQKASWSFSEAWHSRQKICILPLSLNQRNECPWYVIFFQTLLSCFSFLLPASPREPIPLLLYCRIPQPKVASFYNNNPDLEVIINHIFNPISSEVFKVTSPRPLRMLISARAPNIKGKEIFLSRVWNNLILL